ncbi:MAG: hypothetical protein H0W08_25195 [Acidobacteria bacterium]|nr:hypothetical protein [Acidobacteriota bacterium]
MNKNRLEWTVFAVSLALIAGVVSLLVYQHFASGDAPPSIFVTAGPAITTGGGFAVPFDIRNEGDVTAEDVRVEATLNWPGGSERGETVVPLVPYRSHRRAWIAFTRGPAGATLHPRVLGFREP